MGGDILVHSEESSLLKLQCIVYIALLAKQNLLQLLLYIWLSVGNEVPTLSLTLIYSLDIEAKKQFQHTEL